MIWETEFRRPGTRPAQALGMRANTTIFGAINVLMLRPGDIKEPDRLAQNRGTRQCPLLR